MKTITNYIKLEKDEFKKVKLDFSYQTIKRVDKIINYHNNNEETKNDAIFLNIFGLLQSLFVAIDSLYTFTQEITNSKSYININQNDVLNRLKYIRNDVVGHPINRRYGRHSIGYAVIKTDNLSYDKFEYVIYVKNKNGKVQINSYDVNLDELKNSYLNEKNLIFKKLESFVAKKFKKTNLSNLILELFNNLNKETIDAVRQEYYKHFGNTSNDRFSWRLDLLEILNDWQVRDNDIFEVLKYLENIQINKLIEFSNSLENKTIKTKKITYPKLLNDIFEFFNENTELFDYLKDLHDVNSPYYGYNLHYLIDNVEYEPLLKLLNVIKYETNRNKIYLIGSIFNNYQKNLKI